MICCFCIPCLACMIAWEIMINVTCSVMCTHLCSFCCLFVPACGVRVARPKRARVPPSTFVVKSTTMGAMHLAVSKEPLDATLKCDWGTRRRWMEEKERQSTFVAAAVLQPTSCFDIIQKIYVSLGGERCTQSPIFLKGGAAASLYISQQVQSLGAVFPPAFTSPQSIADLDFGCSREAGEIVPKVGRSLAWLSQLAEERSVIKRFEKRWSAWRVRRDEHWGESFAGGRRGSLGTTGDKRLAVKATYHCTCFDKHSGEEFRLVRVGLGVWSEPLRRASVANFVDISIVPRCPTTVDVIGMRVQAPGSMLRTIRRLAFHETAYKPWQGADNKGKLCRRFDRLIKLSIVEDFKLMGGRFRGDDAMLALLRRWRRVPELLLVANADAVYAMSESAPAQLSYFLRVCARTCVEAAEEDMPAYDWWLSVVISPLVAKLAE